MTYNIVQSYDYININILFTPVAKYTEYDENKKKYNRNDVTCIVQQLIDYVRRVSFQL